MDIPQKRHRLAERSEGVHRRPEFVTRHVPQTGATEILRNDHTKIRMDIGCVVLAHPYEYKLIHDNVLDNREFIRCDHAIRAHFGLPAQSLDVVRVTPTRNPILKITSDLVVEGINTGDTVGLLIEVRCLKGNTYTISPIRIHVY